MDVAFPYDIDTDGTTATTADDRHLRDLLEQLLLTSPGERVNRPDFGTGLLQLAFEPNDATLASTLQLSVQGAIQQWLGDRLELEEVAVESRDSTLRVTVAYKARGDDRRRVESFERTMG